MALEQLGKDTVAGSVAPGLHREVIACGAATTLVAADSGALILQDTAAGSIVTLPPPVAGMQFEIVTSVSVTSNSHIINTDAATTFINGGVDSTSTTVAEGGDTFVADGTSDVTLTSNGSTTGGLKGSAYRFTAVSSTVWMCTGVMAGTGTLATPFA